MAFSLTGNKTLIAGASAGALWGALRKPAEDDQSSWASRVATGGVLGAATVAAGTLLFKNRGAIAKTIAGVGKGAADTVVWSTKKYAGRVASRYGRFAAQKGTSKFGAAVRAVDPLLHGFAGTKIGRAGVLYPAMAVGLFAGGMAMAPKPNAGIVNAVQGPGGTMGYDRSDMSQRVAAIGADGDIVFGLGKRRHG